MDWRRLFLLLLLFILYSNCYAKGIISNESMNKDLQGKQNSDSKDINIFVQSIETKLLTFYKIETDIMNKSTEGGFVIGYFDGQFFVKYSASYFGEIGMLERQYYLNNNKLVFVIDKEQLYDKPICDGEVKIVKVTIIRYYIENNQIKLILDDKNNIIKKIRAI